jgi:hypothetical protein
MAHCGCRNHLGKPKQMHKSKAAAIKQILHTHLKHGAHEVVECKQVKGIYHVRSLKATR